MKNASAGWMTTLPNPVPARSRRQWQIARLDEIRHRAQIDGMKHLQMFVDGIIVALFVCGIAALVAVAILKAVGL